MPVIVDICLVYVALDQRTAGAFYLFRLFDVYVPQTRHVAYSD